MAEGERALVLAEFRDLDAGAPYERGPAQELKRFSAQMEQLLGEPGKPAKVLEWLHKAQGRLDQRVAMLRQVEAPRLYAALHQGSLPTKLSEVPGRQDMQRNANTSFDHKEGSAVAGWTAGEEFGAHAHTSRRARNCAEWHRAQDVAQRSLARTGWPGVRASSVWRRGRDHRPFTRRGPTRPATEWPDRHVKAPRKELPADLIQSLRAKRAH